MCVSDRVRCIETGLRKFRIYMLQRRSRPETPLKMILKLIYVVFSYDKPYVSDEVDGADDAGGKTDKADKS